MGVGFGAVLLAEIFFPAGMTLFNHILNLTEGGDEADLLYRFIIIVMWSITSGMMVPFFHYGFVAKKKYGMNFAMLPASKSEKYWAMMLMSGIVVPLLMLVCTVALDTLLALLNIGPWKAFVWQLEELSLIKPMDWLCMVTCYPVLVAGFVWINGLGGKLLRIVLPVILFGYGVIFLLVEPLMADTLGYSSLTYWIIAIVQILLALLAIWLGKRTLDRKSY